MLCQEENMEQLKVEGISKSFDGERVLEDISIALNKGELVSLLGISGGGKTTLFNIIAGLSRPDTGHVLLDGEDVTGCPGRVSYMLQKDLLLPYRTIEDNVALPLIVKGMKKREAREAAFPYFRQFGLEGTQKKYPAQLSGGMRQRAALLRTYLFSGSVALLDEPFSALDYQTRLTVSDDIGQILRHSGKTALLVTHDLSEAISLSDRIIVLSRRPATVSTIIPVTFSLEHDTPLNRRNAPEFKTYFNQLWKELNQNETLA